MKKILFICLVTLLLVGCSGEIKIDENINEELAKGSLQVMNIIEKAAQEDKTSDELNDSNYKKLVSYQNKYVNPEESFMVLGEADEDIIVFALAAISKYSDSGLLASDKEDFLESKEIINKIIKQGKTHAKLKD